MLGGRFVCLLFVLGVFGVFFSGFSSLLVFLILFGAICWHYLKTELSMASKEPRVTPGVVFCFSLWACILFFLLFFWVLLSLLGFVCVL